MLKIKQISTKTPFLNIDSLEIRENTVIIGPSGAGKTSLLRCIAGLNKYQGKIFINNMEATKTGPSRNVSMAWQDGRLLPNFTVKQNIEIGGDTDDIQRLSKLFRIEHLLDKLPHEISGGEAQRVNILRAICSDAKLVLLDEPMQGVDPIVVRKTLKIMLNELKKKEKIALLVTHELYQVYGLIDNVIAMRNGEVVSHDKFKTLYDNPPSPWLANFFGSYTVLNQKDLFCFDLHRNENPCMVRPEWFKIKVFPHKQPNEYNATITGVRWSGPSNKVSLEIDSTKKPITVEVYTDVSLKKGERVYVNFKKCSRPSWITNS